MSNRRDFIKKSSLLAGLSGFTATSLPAVVPSRIESISREVIPLWDPKSVNNGVYDKNPPQLDLYIPSIKTEELKGLVIVCPGGGYRTLAEHEGQPFAELFAVHGLVSAVLTYRVHPDQWPGPYSDACRAIRLMRKYATDFSIDPQKIALMGFSAGGHLAATVSTQPDLYHEPEDTLSQTFSARPNKCILAYPVISFSEAIGHQGSFQSLFGENAPENMREQLSNELHVTPDSPPTFLFHTANDPVVPVSNSLAFAEACVAQQVPVSLHVFPKGRHGVGMAADIEELSFWTGILMNWLQDWLVEAKL